MRALMSFAALALTGCASVTTTGNTFQGANDFRIVSVPDSWRQTPPTPEKDRLPLAGYSRFQRHPTQKEMASRPDDYFKSGEQIQITMKTGFINTFTEGVEQEILNKFVGAILSQPSPVKGEIAIVANVTEGKTTPGGRDVNGELMGKVVFFSDDVYMRQLLNEFNVPIYGPLPYEGGELTIDLWVLELDRAESEQFGAVLRSLADASGDVAGLSIPGLNILSKVGSAFLNSNEDDIIGHIKFTLVPPQPGALESDPILRTSDIIITRAVDRSVGNRWNSCEYRVLRGVMFCPQGTEMVPTSDNMLVLSVRKAVSTVDLTPDLDWKTFSDRVKSAPSPDALNVVIDDFANVSAREANRRASMDAAKSVLDPLTSSLVRERDADFLLLRIQCTMLVDKLAGMELIDEVCGEHAAERQLRLSELDNIVRRLQSGTQLACGALTLAAITPANADSDILAQVRRNFVTQLVPDDPKACPLS